MSKPKHARSAEAQAKPIEPVVMWAAVAKWSNPRSRTRYIYPTTIRGLRSDAKRAFVQLWEQEHVGAALQGVTFERVVVSAWEPKAPSTKAGN